MFQQATRETLTCPSLQGWGMGSRLEVVSGLPMKQAGTRAPWQKIGFEGEAFGAVTPEQVITHRSGAKLKFGKARKFESLAKAQVNEKPKHRKLMLLDLELQLEKPCN